MPTRGDDDDSDTTPSLSSSRTVACCVVPTATTPAGSVPNVSDTVSSALSVSSLAVISNDRSDTPAANDNDTVPSVRFGTVL